MSITLERYPVTKGVAHCRANLAIQKTLAPNADILHFPIALWTGIRRSVGTGPVRPAFTFNALIETIPAHARVHLFGLLTLRLARAR